MQLLSALLFQHAGCSFKLVIEPFILNYIIKAAASGLLRLESSCPREIMVDVIGGGGVD